MSIDLEILLNDTPVARLSRGDDRLVRLTFHRSYVEATHRPILSLYYLGKLRTPLDPEPRVPDFFANLLPDPDGPLRALIAAAASARDDQEMRLLAYLGDDLPGAVRVRASELDDEAPYPLPAPSRHLDGPRLRFSLAGIQLKFSMMRAGKGLTLPASGRGGDWIVKLPDAEFPGVPEAEYAAMEWARASGIDIPALELVTFAQLSGIPPLRGAHADASLCLAIRRFDRAEGGTRIHIEDCAQVFGRAPSQKYNEHLTAGAPPIGYETLARAVAVYAPNDRRELVRRLIFMLLSGNADAHLKNWSFIYLDGRRPRLAPAYDLVPTIVFPATSDRLALPFFGDTDFEAITPTTLERLAPQLSLSVDEIRAWVREDIDRIMDAWSGVKGLDLDVRHALTRHHARLRRRGLLAAS